MKDRSDWRQLEVVRSEHLKVGDILELSDDSIVPTDCLLLSTEDARGECFVQTSQLDGERNLKPKLCLK